MVRKILSEICASLIPGSTVSRFIVVKKYGSLKQNEVKVSAIQCSRGRFYIVNMKYLRQSTYKLKLFLLAYGSTGYYLRLNSPSYSDIDSTLINQLTYCGGITSESRDDFEPSFVLCEDKELCFSL